MADIVLAGNHEKEAALHFFVGHTHTPAILTTYENRDLFPIEHDWNRHLTFIGPRTIFYVPRGSRRIEGLTGRKLVVNPGSVGQPRAKGSRW